jgi:hypothetical protein
MMSDIVGLYNTVDEATFRPKVRMIRYIDSQLYQSPVFNMSAEMVQDLKAFLPKEKVEMEISNMIQSQFDIKDYKLMTEVEIQKASEQIDYLKRVILRDKKISEILS